MKTATQRQIRGKIETDFEVEPYELNAWINLDQATTINIVVFYLPNFRSFGRVFSVKINNLRLDVNKSKWNH